MTPSLPIAGTARPPARLWLWLPAVPLALAALLLFDPTRNTAAFLALQGLARSVPDLLWSWLTVLGTGACAYMLLAAVMRSRPALLGAALLTLPFGGLYTHGLKPLFAAPRPAAVLGPEQIHVVGETLRHNAFPSGHAVTAFAFAALVVLASHRPARSAAWVLPLAALVALSRVAVGAHWPLDIAAGAAGGWLCGALGHALAQRWRGWPRPAVVRVMALIMLITAASLASASLGYPLAVPLQYALAVAGGAGALWALVQPRSA